MEEAFLDSPTFNELLRGLPSPHGGLLSPCGDLMDLGDIEDLPYVILELPSGKKPQQLFQQPFMQPVVQQLSTQEQQLSKQSAQEQQPAQAFYEADPGAPSLQPSVAFYEADFLGTPEEGDEHIKKILDVQSFKVRKPMFPYKPSSFLQHILQT